METLDELLITIPNCGHVFTVETLDGHLHMTDYYEQDQQTGRWVGLRTPPVGFLTPPTCPSCRATITCPRYGRIFKRADLDILENNIASSMSRSLAHVASRVDAFPKAAMLEKMKADGADTKLNVIQATSVDGEHRQHKLKSSLLEDRGTPIAIKLLDPLDDLHGIPTPEARTWRGNVRDLLTAYRDTCNIAATRSPHKHAWEASYTYLYQQEMGRFIQDPIHAPRNTEEYAMRIAKLRTGQPPPRADMRFLVEAFWSSVGIRLTLCELTRAWLDGLAARPQFPKENRKLWELYIFFVLRSCVRDLEIALAITQDSESRRQEIKTTLLLMRIELEQFSFNVEVLRATADKFTPDRRLEVANRAVTLRTKARENIATVSQKYRAHIRISGNSSADLDWLRANFSNPSETLLQEWTEIEKRLRRDEPLSREELRSIVQVLMANDITFVEELCNKAVVPSVAQL
ncbi:hypothetical protein EIP86_010904 [Pleurotus ostreatoroseus]|nr:hypothetical protein EIP86_010904 [Pleurotus ostreatoroseus]